MRPWIEGCLETPPFTMKYACIESTDMLNMYSLIAVFKPGADLGEMMRQMNTVVFEKYGEETPANFRKNGIRMNADGLWETPLTSKIRPVLLGGDVMKPLTATEFGTSDEVTARVRPFVYDVRGFVGAKFSLCEIRLA